MKRTLTLALTISAALTFAISSTAFAASPAPMSVMQMNLDSALGSAIGTPISAKAVTTRFGRNDLLVRTTSTKAQVVANLKDARVRGASFNGYKVLGWAKLATGSYTFSLAKDGMRTVVQVSGDSNATLRYWGVQRPMRGETPNPGNHRRRGVRR